MARTARSIHHNELAYQAAFRASDIRNGFRRVRACIAGCTRKAALKLKLDAIVRGSRRYDQTERAARTYQVVTHSKSVLRLLRALKARQSMTAQDVQIELGVCKTTALQLVRMLADWNLQGWIVRADWKPRRPLGLTSNEEAALPF